MAKKIHDFKVNKLQQEYLKLPKRPSDPFSHKKLK